MKKIGDDLIIYEDNHILVCKKEEGLLSQKDISNDEDILTLLKGYLKEKYQKPGNVFLGLCHRLDRRVSGVMVFAKTSKAASRISASIRNHEFKKVYLAVVVGRMDGKGQLNNKLSKVDLMALEDDDGKDCCLEYEVINHFKMNDDLFSVLKINLITGRFNQIRKQLSLINHPLINDFKYGYRGKNYEDSIGLICYSISFPHPITKEDMVFTYPYSETNSWKKYMRIEKEQV